MQNQRGFVGVGILIAILVGLAVLGGGAYYVVHQQSAAQTPSGNFDTTKTLPLNNAQTQQVQKTETTNTQAQNPSSIPPSASTQSVSVAVSEKYILAIPSNWRTEEVRYTAGGNSNKKDIFVYDEKNKLVMKITQPLREVGYEGEVNTVQSKLGTGIGAFDVVLRGDSATPTRGMMHYTWDGGSDFWNNSFEIFVYFGNWQYFKTAADQQANKGVPLKFTSLDEIKSTGVYRSQIEDIIGGLRVASIVPSNISTNTSGTITANAEYGYTGTFSATPGSGSAPLSVKFSSTIQSAGDISIDYGDGSSCSTANPDGSQTCALYSHIYSTSGTYTAILYRHLPTTELARLTISVVSAGY